MINIYTILASDLHGVWQLFSICYVLQKWLQI